MKRSILDLYNRTWNPTVPFMHPMRSKLTFFAWCLVNAAQVTLLAVWTLILLMVALPARWLTGGTSFSLAMAHHAWSPFIVRLAGTRLEVTGLERLESGRSYFFAVNHQSILDVLVLYRAFSMPLRFVLKEELGRIPLFGTYVRLMGMVLIKRQARRQAVHELLQSALDLPAGHCLVAFPEGTRGDGLQVGPFKSGVFVPALEGQLPVVPIAMDGPARLLPKGTFRVRPGVVRVVVGEPIPTDGMTRTDRRQIARRAEEAVRKQWQELSP